MGLSGGIGFGGILGGSLYYKSSVDEKDLEVCLRSLDDSEHELRELEDK